MFHSTVRVIYPLQNGTIVLRTEQDWGRDIESANIAADKTVHTFEISHDRPFLHFKPCIRDGWRFEWAQGSNKLLVMSNNSSQDFYPYFYSGQQGRMTGVIELSSAHLQRNHRFRMYLPAGYDENGLKRYPVLYMHDGANLFFPEEAFLAQEWRIDETLDMLDVMNLIDRTIVVGVHAGDRFFEYTQPGYEVFGRSLIDELKVWVDDHFRTLTHASATAVMGSSLGGVVSFYLAWQYPEIFGNAACMSSTFSYRDDLIERVRREPQSPRNQLKIYLDSGWPGDNYEVTFSMAGALLERGFQHGKHLLHFAFPYAGHNEGAWSARSHLPIQHFFGKIRRA